MTPSRQPLTILIPDGESHFTLSVATCLGMASSTRVHVLSSDSHARVRRSKHCASFEVVPEAGEEKARLEAVKHAIERYRPHVILPVCETGLRLLQHHGTDLASRVKLAGFPSEEALEIASDK